MFENIEPGALGIVNKAMNTSFYRQQLIMDNIANIDTPNHTYSDMNFKEHLQGLGRSKEKLKLIKTNDVHIPGDKPNPMEQFPIKNYNESCIEQEMSNLIETTLFFEAMVQVHNAQTGIIRSAITGGR